MCAQRLKQSKKSRAWRKKTVTAPLISFLDTDATDIETLYLSPLTQIFVGCRIGEDITVITSWIFIEKEKILDHLEFYEENSEFFRIQKQINEYPDTKIMIGSCSFITNIAVDFYVCTTVKSRKRVENFMKNKNELMMKKIMDSMYRRIGRWNSLGSEEQVINEMTLNQRMLLAVEIEADFPIHKTKAHFRMKLAEELFNGYVELPAGRPTNMQFAWRRRIDRASQITSKKQNKSIQTLVSTVCPQSTQYSYGALPQIPKTIKPNQELKHFLKTKLNHMCDLLNVNFHINLYENDYGSLKGDTKSMIMQKPLDIKSYHDVINCRRTKVSCLSWNAIISGVVAAAYSNNPLLSVSKRSYAGDVLNPTADNHLILIWYYSDNVRPKLYLHAKAEVTALSFCPYDENILVAGYRNGLIAIWDLTDFLTASETPKFLTDQEQRYHLLMFESTEWFKRPLDSNHIFPALTCDFQIGHSSPVTSIVWLPLNHYISRMKKYEKCEEGEEHMQFLTVALNGSEILVWDLKNKEYQAARNSKKGRLSTTPEALTKNTSPLHKLKKHFKPVCKFVVPKQNNTSLLIKMVMKNELYEYSATNPDTLNDLDAATYYTVNKLAFGFDVSRKIIFTTGLGVVQIAFWEDTDYIEAKPVGVCKIQTYGVVHDGPILVCEINSYFPDMILTVGGSVFAIWDCVKSTDALVWRKSLHRYQSGMWCFHSPLSILVVRVDRYYEFWNLCERSDNPTQLYKYNGYDLITFYGDSTKIHSRKNTFITTDALGAFKVFSLPSEVTNKSVENITKATEYIRRIYEFKEHLKVLKATCTKQMEANKGPDETVDGAEPVSKQEIVAEPADTKPKKPPKLSMKARFEVNLERHMVDVHMQRKNINVAAIREANLRFLEQEALKKSPDKKKQLDHEKILAAAQERIFENIVVSNKVRRRISVTFTKEKALTLKKRYMESFKEIEREMIRVIRNQNYTPTTQMVDHCRPMRKKFESMAHRDMKHLKRKVYVTTEADIIKQASFALLPNS